MVLRRTCRLWGSRSGDEVDRDPRRRDLGEERRQRKRRGQWPVNQEPLNGLTNSLERLKAEKIKHSIKRR